MIKKIKIVLLHVDSLVAMHGFLSTSGSLVASATVTWAPYPFAKVGYATDDALAIIRKSVQPKILGKPSVRDALISG